jgi:hypothetical protein
MIPTYEMLLNDETDGVTIISLVKNPANQTLFVKMNSQQVIKLAENKMKQQLVGPVLIPDQLIYRRDEDGTEYNITFSQQVIEDIRLGFHASTGDVKLTNIEHSDNTLKGVVLNSVLLSEDNRGEYNKLGFQDLPDGTWMVTYYIPSANDWKEYVMSGQVKGFSIEAYLNTRIKMSVTKISLEMMLDKLLAAEDMSEEMIDVLLKTIDDMNE